MKTINRINQWMAQASVVVGAAGLFWVPALVQAQKPGTDKVAQAKTTMVAANVQPAKRNNRADRSHPSRGGANTYGSQYFPAPRLSAG